MSPEISFPAPIPESIIESNSDTYDSAIHGCPSALVDLGSIIESMDCKDKTIAKFCYDEAAKIINGDNDVRVQIPQTLPSIQFDDIRRKVIDLTNNELVSKTKHSKVGGIYMLYVDCFKDDRIIPFYIGRTNSFSKRFGQHISAIKKLMAYSKRKYNSLVEEGEFEGHYLYCKMYSFMDRHDCSIDDVKMVIVEEVESEKQRGLREDHFITSLKAPFFGFNQYLFHTHLAEQQSINSLKDEKTVDDLTRLIKEEIPKMAMCYQYGYNMMNTYLTLPLYTGPDLDNLFFFMNGLDVYISFLKEYRSEIKKTIELHNSLLERAEYEVENNIVTITPCPAADKAREQLLEMFKDVTEPEYLIELCIDAIFQPDSISSVKIWGEAKKKGFWDDPLYEFKKRYPTLYQECLDSPRPIPPADTMDKKIELIHRQMVRELIGRFIWVNTN